MLYIVHGEDTVSSRNFILNLQNQNKVSVKTEYSLDQLDLAKLQSEASTADMFGETRLIVLDVSKMGRTNVDNIVEFLPNIPSEFLFVVYSNKELSKVNAFIKASVKLKARVVASTKKPSANIFAFVDAVFNKQRNQAFKELQKLLLMGEDAVYLLTMLEYGLRSVAYAKFNSPLFEKVPPFSKQKVKSQAENFSKEKIIELVELFYEMDRGIKMGEYDQNTVIPMAVEKVITYK